MRLVRLGPGLDAAATHEAAPYSLLCIWDPCMVVVLLLVLAALSQMAMREAGCVHAHRNNDIMQCDRDHRLSSFALPMFATLLMVVEI